MKETQFRKNGKNDGRAGEKDTQKKQKSKAFKKEKTKENKRKQKNTKENKRRNIGCLIVVYKTFSS